jgi:DNA adenine methylase
MPIFTLSLSWGGANVIDKISCNRKMGYDINHYLIELFKNMDLITTLPDEITKDEYDAVRKSYQTGDHQFPDWYIGAVGFLASYNGKFFGGRAGTVKTKIGTIRNYYDEAKRNLLNQIPSLQGVEFAEFDYQQLDQSKYEHGVIYCDIPYANTTGYQQEFDHEQFWNWAEEMSAKNIVLVSEQAAPVQWKSIWSQPVKRTLDNASRLNITEQLYILDT